MTDIDLLERTLGPFKIMAELGRGGMAVVYKAFQTDLHRTVALKILPPELGLDRSYLQRFLQEARSAAALEHPHIVPIYAIGAAEGFNYIAMKYISGKTLKDIVYERGKLDVPEAVTMLEQVADALDYAHSQGVIHRDIKPSNMMAEQNGWVYLTDFGLARSSASGGLTMAGTVMGTPEYMSPEQAQGLATIGSATDIYALGVVLYEMLTGQMPFQADTPMGMLVARLQHAPRPPRDYRGDLPMPVEDVIMRALARKPEARFGSAKELIVALKHAAGLGTRSLAPQQRPASPPLGTPAVTQVQPPVSPAYGVQPTLPASPPLGTQRPAPSPAAGAPTAPASHPALPPTEVMPALNTPPYVIPTSGAAVSAPRAATPPMPAAAPNTGTTMRDKPRARKGIGIALGAIALVLVAAFLVDAFVLRRADPRIEQGLKDGQAALAQKGGMDRAIDSYKQVLEIAPKHAEAHAQLALIYSLRHRNADAITEARAAIDADPQLAFGHAVLADVLSGEGEYDEASTAADKAIELNDKLSFAYGARASIKANQALEDSDEDLLGDAADDADKALELAQHEDNLAQALAHSARGYVYWQEYLLTDDTSKVDSGVEEFNKAIGLQGQIALFHSNLGYFYDAQAKHDLAQKKFEAALEADEQYGHAHAGLGWNLYYLEDYDGALREFEKAIEIEPADTDAHIGMSYAYQKMDQPDFDAAIAALEKAAEVAPQNPNVFSNLGWTYRKKAFSLEYGSDDQKATYAESEAQFRKATELNARYVDALTGLGVVLLNQADTFGDGDKYTESIETLKKSLEIKEKQSFATDALGWSHYGLKQYEDAEQAFRAAIAIESGYADAYYGLGRTLQDQGRVDEARTAYETAVQEGSDSAQDALDQLK
jgi:eukaryotic-like serine/threonine-protein kinase